MLVEHVMEQVAAEVGRDPAEVRALNFMRELEPGGPFLSYPFLPERLGRLHSPEPCLLLIHSFTLLCPPVMAAPLVH